MSPWNDEVVRDRAAAELHDLRGDTVIPGLVDAHAHLCHGSPGSPSWLTTATDSVGVVAWGLAGCISALRAGITTVVDVGSPEGLALRLPKLIDAGIAVGPNVMAAGQAITTTAGHGTEIGATADSATQIVEAVRRCVGAGADIIKLMVTGGASDTTLTNRRRSQYTEEELVAGIDDAHRLGKVVVGHANATEGINRAVNAGIDIVAHCNWLGIEPATVVIDSKTVETMVSKGTWIDLNIQGAMRSLNDTDGSVVGWQFGGPPPATRWDLLQPLRQAGVGLYLTSDAYGSGVGSFTESLCRLRARWNLSAEEMISLVTEKPARALGIVNERGILSPGTVADFVVLQGDLRSNEQALMRPRAVFRGGIEVISDGCLTPPAVSVASGQEAASQQELLDIVFKKLV